MRLYLRMRYRFVQAAWDFGTWLREKACVWAGGCHDTIGDDPHCICCGKDCGPTSDDARAVA